MLLQLLARELGAQPQDIVDFELNVCDVQPGTIGGERRVRLLSMVDWPIPRL